MVPKELERRKRYLYTTEGVLVQVFTYQTALAKWLGVPRTSDRNYMNTGRVFQGKYLIRDSMFES